MQQEKKTTPIRKKKKKRTGLRYLILFTLVFISALFGLSYIVKSYSPDVDVAIGNNEALTLSEEDIDVEMRTIDERLKWIQLEDEMPTVAVREPEENEEFSENNIKKDKKNKKFENDKTIKEALKDKFFNKKEKENTEEETKQQLDFRLHRPTPVIEAPKPIITEMTKVYLGNYSTIEEAMNIQQKVAAEETDIIPFIKAIGSYYVVQIGSFADKDKADALIQKMQAKGYSARKSIDK